MLKALLKMVNYFMLSCLIEKGHLGLLMIFLSSVFSGNNREKASSFLGQ